jgi:thiol-disulfide isomerase/thioredoxin
MTFRDLPDLSIARAAPRGRPCAFLTCLPLLFLIACNAPDKEQTAVVPAPAPYSPPEVKLATPAEIQNVIRAERGNVVVINFWATWCPPCVKEMPELAAFWREFDGKGVRFLSISADHQSLRDSTVIPFVKSYEVPFPVRILYVDSPDEINAALPLTWEGRQWDGALPATFVFDRDGNQVWSTVGEVTRDSLAEKVTPLLATGE